MTKVVNSSEYSTNSIFVGCAVNEDGEALVEVNGKAIGTVTGLLEFIGSYRDQQTEKVNVKWAAVAPPEGYCSGYRSADMEVRAPELKDVPDEPEHHPFVVKDGVMHLDNVDIKDAQIRPLNVETANAEDGKGTHQIAALIGRLDSLEAVLSTSLDALANDIAVTNASIHQRVDEALRSAWKRNVGPT